MEWAKHEPTTIPLPFSTMPETPRNTLSHICNFKTPAIVPAFNFKIGVAYREEDCGLLHWSEDNGLAGGKINPIRQACDTENHPK